MCKANILLLMSLLTQNVMAWSCTSSEENLSHIEKIKITFAEDTRDPIAYITVDKNEPYSDEYKKLVTIQRSNTGRDHSSSTTEISTYYFEQSGFKLIKSWTTYGDGRTFDTVKLNLDSGEVFNCNWTEE